MTRRDDDRDQQAREREASLERSRRVLGTGFAALATMAVAALLTPPLFLS